MDRTGEQPTGRTNSGAGVQGSAEAREEIFLHDLGQKVRALRADRGMSRKALADLSGLSERYIAQFESGKGNVSVILLRRVCAATGVNIEDMFGEPRESPNEWAHFRKLVRGATPAQIASAKAALTARAATNRHQSPERIALVGLRGAGKSTLGKLLAQQLGCPFVELNREIEREHGLSVNEIFALYGQDGYRRLEQACLRALILRPGAMVLATNGGLVAEAMSYDLLLESFFTIWIRARADEHMSRVQKQGTLRPVVEDQAAMQELRSTLAARTSAYARANAVVDTSGQTVETSLADMAGVVRRNRTDGERMLSSVMG